LPSSIRQSKPAATKLEVFSLLIDTMAWTCGLPSQRRLSILVGAIAQVDVDAVLAPAAPRPTAFADEGDVVLVDADEGFAGQGGRGDGHGGAGRGGEHGGLHGVVPSMSPDGPLMA
jgi:hypothetical protein